MAEVVRSSRADLLAQRDQLARTLALVEDPANNPWILRGQIDSIDFLLADAPPDAVPRMDSV